MYDKYEDTTVITINNTRIKSSRAYSNVKHIVNSSVNLKHSVDKMATNRLLNEHLKVANNKLTSNIKINSSIAAKSVSKNITNGTIRINSRVAESLYNKNDDFNTGSNAFFSAQNKARRAVEVSKNTINNTKTAYKTAKATGRVTANIAKQTMSLLTKFIASNPLVFICAIVVFIIFVISGYMNDINDEDELFALIAGISTHSIIVDDDSIEKYKDLNKKLDYEINDISAEYEDYEIVEVNGYAETSLKEILSIFAVIKEQDIGYSDANEYEFKDIHDKFYSVDAESSIEYCDGCYCSHDSNSNCPGNCECIGHSKIEINIDSYTFEEILDILNFNDEQKEWVRKLVEADYNELYENFE